MKYPRLVSSNSNPERHIPPAACETVRRLIRARQEVFELIEQLESETRMRFDDALVLEALDLDYSDWPAGREITQPDARAFLGKVQGSAVLDADKRPETNPPDGVTDLAAWQTDKLMHKPGPDHD